MLFISSVWTVKALVANHLERNAISWSDWQVKSLKKLLQICFYYFYPPPHLNDVISGHFAPQYAGSSSDLSQQCRMPSQSFDGSVARRKLKQVHSLGSSVLSEQSSMWLQNFDFSMHFPSRQRNSECLHEFWFLWQMFSCSSLWSWQSAIPSHSWFLSKQFPSGQRWVSHFIVTAWCWHFSQGWSGEINKSL